MGVTNTWNSGILLGAVRKQKQSGSTTDVYILPSASSLLHRAVKTAYAHFSLLLFSTNLGGFWSKWGEGRMPSRVRPIVYSIALVCTTYI